MTRIVLMAAAAMALMIGPAAADDDAVARGKRAFNQCGACHALKEGRNRVGPSLHCIVGRQAASAPRYRYSKSLKAVGEKGLVWTEANLFDYLEDPRKFLEDKLDTDRASNKMVNRYKREKFRRDVIAYLKAAACK